MPCLRAAVMDELKRLGARKELVRELETWEQKALPVNPMECVARGACLKAGGVVTPSVRTDPNSYGTIIDRDRFYSIIPANSDYPITLAESIIHYNPEARRVPISLVKKLPYAEGRHIVYKYYYLGDYDCYIRTTGERPEIDITMELTDDKALITTFTHVQTHESVRFERLDELKGSEITLREKSLEEPPHRRGEDEGERPGGVAKIRRHDWTQEQLNKAVHVARMLVDDFAERSQDNKVTRKKMELLDLIQSVREPNDTRFIMRRMQELLNALKNASEISEKDFSDYLEELREIERGA